MCAVSELVEHVRASGFEITISDRGPKLVPVTKAPAISAETVTALRENRNAVIDYITARQAPKPRPTTTPPASSWETCRTCRAEVETTLMAAHLGLCPTPTKCPYATPEPCEPRSRPSSPGGSGTQSPGTRPATTAASRPDRPALFPQG